MRRHYPLFLFFVLLFFGMNIAVSYGQEDPPPPEPPPGCTIIAGQQVCASGEGSGGTSGDGGGTVGGGGASGGAGGGAGGQGTICVEVNGIPICTSGDVEVGGQVGGGVGFPSAGVTLGNPPPPLVPAIPVPTDSISRAPIGANGEYIGTLEDAEKCPYIKALQNAQPGSFEAMMMQVGRLLSDSQYTLRTSGNYLGKYNFSEASLQICVEADGNPLNNNYGADLNANTPAEDVLATSSTDSERWKSGLCKIKSADLPEVSANIRNSQDWLTNPCLQEALFRKLLLEAKSVLNDSNVQRIMCHKLEGSYKVEHNRAASTLGSIQETAGFITPSGMVYAAYVWGPDALKRAVDVYLNGGEPAVILPTFDVNGVQTNGNAGSGSMTAVSYPPGVFVTNSGDIPWIEDVVFANYFQLPSVPGTPEVPDPDCTKTVNPGEVPVFALSGGAVTETKPTYVKPQYGDPPVPTADRPREKPGDTPTLPEKSPPNSSEEYHQIQESLGKPPSAIAEHPSNLAINYSLIERYLVPTFWTHLSDDPAAVEKELSMVERQIVKILYMLGESKRNVLELKSAIASLDEMEKNPGPQLNIVPKK